MNSALFLTRVRDALPSLQIMDQQAAQHRYSPNTHGGMTMIAGAFCPTTVKDIQAIVRVASEEKAALYPISTGQNWGYGTAMPVCGGCYILDLCGMNKIISFDAQIGTVTLEPGVTQGQLATFLSDQNSDYMVPITGAGPQCSLIGNALEHGFGFNYMTDHFSGMMSLQAVMPNGELYQGAHAGKGCLDIDRTYKWGIGPYLDGLFGQFGLGVVTQMTLALAKRTANPAILACQLKGDTISDQTIRAVQGILEEYGGMLGAVKIMNHYTVLAMSAPYPRDLLASGQKMIPPDVMDRLCKDYHIGPWTGLFTIYAPPSCQAAIVRDIKKIMRPHAKHIQVMTKGRLHRISKIASIVPFFPKGWARILEKLSDMMNMMQGYPNETGLPLAYWLKGGMPTNRSLNPGRDGCGILWYAPVVSMQGDALRRFSACSTAILQEHGFEPLLTATSMNNKCFDCTIPILFDATDQDAAKRAQDCYLKLLQAGQEQGAYPYRVGVYAMDHVVTDHEPFWRLAHQIKQAVDPDNIISPGRYSARQIK